MLTNLKIAFLGTGMMGGALARGVVHAGAATASGISLYDLHLLKARQLADELGAGTRVAADPAEAVAGADLVLLAVKPLVMPDVLESIAPHLSPSQIVVSIAAGIRTSRMESILGADIPVIRAMPNTPCLVGAGATAVCRGTHATHNHLQIAQALFAAVGESIEVEERLMDAVTGLSGSGPAYVFMVIESMADGGVMAGLPRDTARMLAAQTVFGAAKMVLSSEEHPAQLRDNVTTPGGTTIAALAVLERAGLRTALMDAIDAATKRSRELS
ncbi:MAG: pyrroline-5-carboxylate reductase [Capsulimonadaceae bacterium]